MFLIRSAQSTQQDPHLLEQDLLQQMESHHSVASITFLFGQHTQVAALRHAQQLWRASRSWLGGSSCLAALSDEHLHLAEPTVVALQIIDPTGAYGVGMTELTDMHALPSNIAKAYHQAMSQAGLDPAHDTPTMLWCYQAPGHEEAVIAQLTVLVGAEVPVFGGSSADDDISGQWWQLANGQLAQHSCVIAVLAPSTSVQGYFGAGYRLTGQSARVTRQAEREVIELDHQPAADVYRRWLGNPPYSLFERTTILSESALTPLGRVVGEHQGQPIVLLSHPAYVEPDQRIGLFSNVQLHEQLHLLAGNQAELAQKAGEVVAETCRRVLARGAIPQGGIVVFCAGSMLAIRPYVAEVLQHIRHQLPELPFVVTFTFGEHGTFVDGQTRHGNLMISSVIFGSVNA